MFFRRKKPESLSDLTMHQGIFRARITLFEGIALMLSGTIGAGVLGLPYAVAKSGVLIGALYIVGIGLLMIGLNLMLGEVAVRTNGSFQLVGFAKKYLGKTGGVIMTIMMYGMLFGALVIYLIGEGVTLAALFGGSAFHWSLIFFVFASMLVIFGMRTLKTAELLLTIGILTVVLLITSFSVPHIDVVHLYTTNLAFLFLPYGVVLFSFHGTTAVPEMYSVLRHDNGTFKKAIIIGGLVVMALYLLFSFVAVGVTGANTTQIATIGLGNQLGRVMFLFGNAFAFFAMATSFLLNGVALKDSLSWDYKLPTSIAALIALGVPLTVVLLGLRQFVEAINIVGGIFGSLEMLLVLLIYWRAKKLGDLDPGKYRLHHIALIGALLLLVLTAGAIYSVFKIFV
ncbi:MAG: hypothetical protein CO030_04435 [Candidatus Magasanikbacteria bacterium CG_4_9_14_0_2_um_filter_42_11]|uniref:Amino acid transporter transmembrane domain-containing protein n=1 Tax=Candidatus Magasanikbacteria bacterium CG_4_9_14_0_2_um_filter_42_11 TaxID=1974643 RepID=A0A2M8F8U5_9BACT|nr:MAG: hypothetical protein COU34_01095 [Candidatus Magasanikbacteria bacterium CG10_big_fil_rev_8_21_14_0_10_43_9]PIY92790.1 MAG: hypothetical protein COY70_01395 [Candidatus Magasanikbacteria bacterium CG_4_10_14_0_8_um_filter_42_12]PJC52142.1 MAG: hypothetical protein CO030_04435 [Candidatus Magasanikbacteria bacterium CG_4_9_14_0_2_um_filter_42_11]